MSSELFAGIPSINIPRSKWNNGSNITGSYKHGYLVPVDCIPVLPGDSINYKFRDLTRLQTPVAPIFGNIKKHVAAFFIPMRLVWNHTEEFFGANKTNAGPQLTTYTIPDVMFKVVQSGSLSHYLGKPLKGSSDADINGFTTYEASILKERCYYLTWSEYFRASQITNPVLLAKGDAGSSTYYAWDSASCGTWNGNNLDPGNASTSLMRVAKQFDVFTACTISPQFGAAVSLPLGDTAPLVVKSNTMHDIGTNSTLKLLFGSNNVAINGPIGQEASNGVYSKADSSWTGTDRITHTNLVADLSTATAAKINDIRYAFQLQKYLELSNFSSNYFFSILQVHYGVTSPDSRLQRPEFLGEFSEDILIHQVTSTADTTNSGVFTPIGNTGAVSATASGEVSLFDKAFVEPGFVLIVMWNRHRQAYSQGIMKEDSTLDRFEIYSPEFCNLGDDSVKTRELYWKAGRDAIFGYQEHFYQYRYRFDRINGQLDPSDPASNLKYWTLGTAFTSIPQLNNDFIMEGRSQLDRALVINDGSVDDYFFDFYQNITWTREMPVRTLPGLIDHFGAM